MSYNFWRGQRVRLRAVEQQDLDELMEGTEEPDSESERADDHITFPSSRESHRKDLEENARKERAEDACFLIIENQAGQKVGYLATFDCDRRVGAFKYSIVLKRPFWGQGYAREAVIILLRYYFRELRYQKVTVLVYSFNERSLHFHQKLGFTYEGRLRRVVYTNGRFYDEVYFGMTTEEFDQLDPRSELVGAELPDRPGAT